MRASDRTGLALMKESFTDRIYRLTYNAPVNYRHAREICARKRGMSQQDASDLCKSWPGGLPNPGPKPKPEPKPRPGYHILSGASSLIPHAGKGLASDFHLNACKNVCRIAVMAMVSKANSQELTKTCVTARNALAAKVAGACLLGVNGWAIQLKGRTA